ncbi:MAG: hypothetical protein QOG15_3364 [Solirubrobacteraceae bacterium]|jgi:hypothetical protein|nr:hypothetical protein [Solirubrobacteraceae bacterium]
MRFSMWLRTRRRVLVKVVVAVVGSLLAGAAIGLAFAALTGDDGPSTKVAGAAVRVQIVSAIMHPAGTAKGRARQRARLSVHARVINTTSSETTFERPRLQSGAALLGIDRNAVQPAGALLRPIAPGSTADGVLRYETAGDLTRRLASRRRATLRIAGRTMAITVIIGSPASRNG